MVNSKANAANNALKDFTPPVHNFLVHSKYADACGQLV
jgi:hypothetical protein